MVLFIIGCFGKTNTGNGGHYFSMLQMSKALSLSSRILVVGDKIPPVYHDVDYTMVNAKNNMDCSNLNIKDSIFEGVTIVHSYEPSLCVLSSKIASSLSVPLVITKPGGPALKKWSVLPKNLVVFHQSDFDFFRKKKVKNLKLISNRVESKSGDINFDRDNPFFDANNDTLKILRIGRISKAYRNTIVQSINLMNELGKFHSNIVLSIVGIIEDGEVYEEIINLTENNNNINILTTKNFTDKAAELIHYTDVVVGTGRGFMEAMEQNKLIFFPVNNSDLPCFVTPETYGIAAYNNFSERTPLGGGVLPLESIHNFNNIYSNGNYLKSDLFEEYSDFVKDKFLKDHDISYGAVKLTDFYNSIKEPEYRKNYISKLIKQTVLNSCKRFKNGFK